MAANTLIGLDRPQQAVLRTGYAAVPIRNPAIDEKEEQLARVRKRHFTARTPRTKHKCREEDRQLRSEISALLRSDGFSRETTEKLAYWDPYDQNASADFFDPEWMFGISRGFDVVIANPPYVRQEQIKDQKPLLQKAGYEVYNSTSDLYTYFYEKSWQILKPDGFLTFISSNKWMRAKYGEKLRQFFKDKTRVMELIDFGGHKVFETTVDTNIMLFQKTKPEEDYKMPFINISNEFDGENLEPTVRSKFDKSGKVW
ncbi:MAG: Type IIS restriction enzyme Eco57I [Dehalococcoidia bacterium]|nr:Type IIS restriction enzyme Eco57I [Chloroflexota bacterium]